MFADSYATWRQLVRRWSVCWFFSIILVNPVATMIFFGMRVVPICLPMSGFRFSFVHISLPLRNTIAYSLRMCCVVLCMLPVAILLKPRRTRTQVKNLHTLSHVSLSRVTGPWRAAFPKSKTQTRLQTNDGQKAVRKSPMSETARINHTGHPYMCWG